MSLIINEGADLKLRKKEEVTTVDFDKHSSERFSNLVKAGKKAQAIGYSLFVNILHICSDNQKIQERFEKFEKNKTNQAIRKIVPIGVALSCVAILLGILSATFGSLVLGGLTGLVVCCLSL